MAAQPICTHCGAKIKLKNSVSAGKKIRCPKCDKFFVVKDEVDLDDEGDEQPAKKKDPRGKTGKGNSLLLVGGIVGVLLVCCTCGGGSGLGWLFRDNLGFGDSNRVVKAKDDKVLDREPEKKNVGDPDRFVLEPEVLANEIQNRPFEVIKRYRNKTVEVSGEVERVIDRNTFQLKGNRKTPLGPGTSLTYKAPAGLEDAVARLPLGQKVKVSSRPDFRLDVAYNLGECTFELEPSKLTVTPAATIFGEFSINRAAATTKYRASGLILSGKLTHVEVRNNITGKKKILDLIEIDAGGPNRIGIRLQEYSSELAFLQNLQPGNDVEIRCEPPQTVEGPRMFMPAGILVRKVR
jgi:DNA-directed RNA polymerase subunit RPC12/RpoP